ncbi:MAG TPA: universal stress protein [Deferrisomatales bacterium]|nr:universal stress protein [Deferrisomatales bacterium]
MIPKMKKILFTTDLSENARHAFYYASSIATSCDAGLVLLYVLDEGAGTMQQQVKNALGEEQWQRLQEKHQQTARDVLIGKRTDYTIVREALGHLCTEARSEDPACSFEALELLVSEGQVVTQILKIAEEKNCDMIVMGAHQGLFHKTRLGTVAKGVLQRSPIPVLLVPPPKAG